MARTRTTLRVKQPPMLPTEIDTPPSAAGASIAVTESSGEPGTAGTLMEESSDNKSDDDEDITSAKCKSDDSDDDTSVKSDTKKPVKRRLSLENSDDENDMTNNEEEIIDDKPVILEVEEESVEESDNEEVVYLGTLKPPAVTHLVPGNSHRNISMTYCVGNVNFGKAYGQFMMVSNGFDQDGSPRHTFRNYLLEVFVKNGTY
jgi:hypothetical protein